MKRKGANIVSELLIPEELICVSINIIKKNMQTSGITFEQGIEMIVSDIRQTLTEDLLMTMPRQQLKQKRDFALTAIALSSELRRPEIASLQVSHLQEIEGRTVILGVLSKRNKLRNIPLAPSTLQAIRDWLEAAKIKEGSMFRPINKGGRVIDRHMTPESIRQIIDQAISHRGGTE